MKKKKESTRREVFLALNIAIQYGIAEAEKRDLIKQSKEKINA